MNADKKEIAFYEHFNVQPKMMSECRFHNLGVYGVEIGNDVCDYNEDENITCKGCPSTVEDVGYYPPIDSTVLVLIVWICGTEEHSTPLYYCTELIDKILNYAIIMSLNSEIYDKIQKVLQNHVWEYYKS